MLKKPVVLFFAAIFALFTITCSKDNVIFPENIIGCEPEEPGTHGSGTNGTELDELWNQGSSTENQEPNEPGEPVINYVSGPDAINWGISANVDVQTLGLTPGNDTTEVYLNWYSKGTDTGKVAKVRFIRGKLTSGTELIEKDGSATAVGTAYTQHKAVVTGLKPGSSYQYAVSSDGNNWSIEYDFKVPAAGAFKFAVITDPQLTTSASSTNKGKVDPNSRYPATSFTTTQSWTETIQKVADAGVSFIASCGDQVDGGSDELEYTNFFTPPGLRELPLSPVMGNHDPLNKSVLFFNHFNIPNEQGSAADTSLGANYYYLYNNILFVVLNTSAYASSSNAASYISRFKTTIRNAKTAHAGKYDWLIVQHHKSTASVGTHCADTDLQSYVEAGFEKLMSDEKVDFIIAGHDHVYARSYPLQGMDGGKVSVADKTNNTNTFNNPGNPIYFTFNTASGLKYYYISADKTFTFSGTVTSNTKYPYLGVDANGKPIYGSTEYKNGKLPDSNLAYSQPLIPSYTIVDVNGRTITFRTYPIASGSGTSPGASAPYSFDADTPYDWVTVTK